jgi:hypothetical protein
MARSGDRRSLLAVLAGLGLVFVATTASWGTLCIGADGHVAFEAVAGGDCVGGAGSGESPAAVVSAKALQGPWPCCGACTDVEGTGAAWLTASPAEKAPGAVPAALVPAPPTASTPRSFPLAAHGVAQGRARRALATTILRC